MYLEGFIRKQSGVEDLLWSQTFCSVVLLKTFLPEVLMTLKAAGIRGLPSSGHLTGESGLPPDPDPGAEPRCWVKHPPALISIC